MFLSRYAILFLLFFSACNPGNDPAITFEDNLEHLKFLASDSLKGREPGTLEDSVLLHYIADKFEGYGLLPLEDAYIQNFRFISGLHFPDSNTISFAGKNYLQGRDFFPSHISSDAFLTAQIMFGGYGFEIRSDSLIWDDYQNINPSGKWVMVLEGEPANDDAFHERSHIRDKALLAADKDATGLLVITDNIQNISRKYSRSIEPEVDIPVIYISRHMANRIVKRSHYTVEQIKQYIEEKGAGLNIEIPQTLHSKIQVNRKYSSTGNVAGYILGRNPSLKNEWIIVGAHHDHLGMGGKGSSSRKPDTLAIHYGADDNASGTATVLELAEYFSAKENHPERSMLFITFGAEERGILGSRYFIDHSPIDLSEISLMLNIDMLGRMKPDSVLQIGGVGTAEELLQLVREQNDSIGLKLNLSKAGYGPSDHASFYAQDVPVLFFSTGAHKDYHTPDDRIDSLNIQGMVLAQQLIAGIARSVAGREQQLIFTEAGPRHGLSGRYRGKVTLGIMPDVSGQGNEGMKVLAVTKGRPAASGGMKKGDVIIAVDGKKVGNVYDYMHRLEELESGQNIIVTVIRGNEKIDLLIEL